MHKPKRPKPRLRALAALALTTALTGAALTGCSPEPHDNITSDPATCATRVESADSVRQIDIGGEFGASATLSGPVKANGVNTVRDVRGDGRGPALTDRSVGTFNFTVFSAETGEAFFDYEGLNVNANGVSVPASIQQFAQITNLIDGLRCAREGQRVVVTIPADTAYPLSRPPQVKSGTTLVIVVDVVRVLLDRAEGEEREVPASLPRVTRDETTGAPSIAKPTTPSPATESEAVLIEGKGDEVGDGDVVTIRYLSSDWTGKQTGTTWGGAANPLTFGVQAGGDPSTLALREAILGKRVGSQVEVVVPAVSIDGQPVNPDDATILVIDILGKDTAS